MPDPTHPKRAKSSWNGHHDKACEALGRITSEAKDTIILNNPTLKAKARRLVARCTELRSYIETNEGALIDYGQRYRAGKPNSTSRAESTVNQLVNARMNKRRQMRAGRPAAPIECFRSEPRCWTDALATNQSSSRRSAPGF